MCLGRKKLIEKEVCSFLNVLKVIYHSVVNILCDGEYNNIGDGGALVYFSSKSRGYVQSFK